MKAIPKLVYADGHGNIFDHPTLEMGSALGGKFTRPAREELIPLPEDSRLFTMPGRIPIGWHPHRGEYFPFTGGKPQGDKGKKRGLKSLGPYYAVAAFPPPGYTRTLLPAAQLVDTSQILPLWAYTAVGWMDGQFWIAATQVDSNPYWLPANFDDRILAPMVDERLEAAPENRLLEQLSRCAIDYHCFAAKNAFLRRWECPIPTSPGCNSRCVGCLSWQPADSCAASHERITFTPSPQEIVEVALPHLIALPHLTTVEKGMVSFGQGCEGDPILQVDVIEEAIRAIRSETSAGSININTNASRPKHVERLCKAGLDSIRISINSAVERTYNRYYRPVNYRFNDVAASAKIAKDYGLFVCINLLTFPGVTDRKSELEAILRLIDQTQLDFIQMRNLSIDPDLYLR
ncbi:radical SAM protein, partial [Candidatus Poribacteria bacterium]|nr:radical SAM protein [Candidatus Poribacteria bacterium]